MLFSLFIILVLVALPVWLWSRSKSLTLLSSFFGLIFIMVYRNFVQGVSGTGHDTYANLQMWFGILNKWVETGADLGWCPYLGGGEPISIFSNFMVWAPGLIVLKAAHLMRFSISCDMLFHFALVASYLSFCTGALLFIDILIKDKRAALFGFSILLLGGFFYGELFSGIVYALILPLPYLLFFITHSIKTKTWTGLFFFSFVFGIAANRYVPHYVALTLAVFFFSAFVYYPKKILRNMKELLGKMPYAVLICIMLFLLTAMPAIYSYSELSGYVSPTRGFSKMGAVNASSQGYQAPTNAPLNSYENLFSKDSAAERSSTHGQLPFYIGVFGVILLLCTRPTGYTGVLFLSGLLSLLIGLGFDTPVWKWAMGKFSFLQVIRHTFQFSVIACFFFIGAIAAGISRFLNSKERYYNAPWIALVSIMLFLIRHDFMLIIAGSVFCLMIIFIRPETKKKKAIIFLLLFILSTLDLIGYSYTKTKKLPRAVNLKIEKMRYPQKWRSYVKRIGNAIPYDFFAILNNTNTWINSDPNYVLLVNREFLNFIVGARITSRPPIMAGTFFFLDNDDRRTLDAFYMNLFTKNRVKDTGGRIAQIDSNDANYISLTAYTPKDAKLLRFENYNAGWEVMIDGKKTSISKVYPGFQSIDIKAGMHKVEFRFRSIYMRLIRINILVSVIGWISMLLWLNRTGYRKE